MTAYNSHRDHRFHYAADAIAHIETVNCIWGCKRGAQSEQERIDVGPGGSCPVLLDVFMEKDEIAELDDHGDKIVCLVREPL